jgi:hypothetical protein
MVAVSGRMGEKPTRLVTKMWLAVCLMVLAVALVPVCLPVASLHGRYDTPHSNRLQRHSFSNVAEGRPDGRLSRVTYQTLPFAVLGLIVPALDRSSLARSVSSAPPLLNTLPHRRKLGRANPGDPDALA